MDNTKYQITKTVRFKLEAAKKESAMVTNRIKALKHTDSTKELSKIVSLLSDFLSEFKRIVYINEEQKQWDWALSIKKKWLNSYRRDIPNAVYIDSEDTAKSIKDLKYVQEYFRDIWIPRIEKIIEKLASYIVEKLELQSRDTIIASQIWSLSKRTNFRLGKDFLSCLKSKNGTKNSDILKLWNGLGHKIEDEIQKLTSGYLPSQSCGVLAAGGSFNYYTINKRRTNFAKERTKIEDELGKAHSLRTDFIANNKLLQKLLLPKIEYKQELNASTSTFVDLYSEKFTLADLVMHLKNYMCYQKKLFNNAIQLIATNTDANKIAEGESVRKKCVLYTFESENDWKQFLDAWKQYLTNDKLSETQKSDKKAFIDSHYVKKGTLDNTKKFKYYQAFCTLLKELSGSLGQITNQLKGIDKEAITAELLKYWCFLLKDAQGDFWIYCVPKDAEFDPKNENTKLNKVFQLIVKNSVIDDSKGTNALYYLNSLTLKALKKLCFSNEDFRASLLCNTRFSVRYNNIEIEDNLNSDLQKINYYQDVLKNVFDNPENFKSLKLEFTNYPELKKLTEENICNLDDFEVKLNKICYKRMIVVKQSVTETLVSQYNAFRFKITSQDIRNKDNKGFNSRSLTKIWNNYWDGKSNTEFDIRMNPEVKIFWRDKRVHEDTKYGKKSPDLFDESKRNRYLHEQFTLALSFTQNANTPVYSRSFEGIGKAIEQVVDFNSKISNLNYALGIDVNKDDLAYATLVKKEGNHFAPQIINENNNSFEVWKLKDDVFKNPNSEIYNFGLKMPFPDHTIRTDDKFRVIKNVSMFVDKKAFDKTFNNSKDKDNKKIIRYSIEDYSDKLFDKNVKITSLSLTRAKVFGNIVVVDGDLTTHAKLKFLNAKRRIVNALHANHDLELCYNVQQENKIICDENRRKFYMGEFDVKGKFIETNTIYVHNQDYATIYPWETVKTELEKLFVDAKNDLKSGIDLEASMATSSMIYHINNIRKVMAGNMVAVIKKIYSTNPCYICFENFDAAHTEARRSEEFDGDIYRPLERALLNSFRSLGVVPVANELVKMRNRGEICQNDISQLGIIKYVPDTNTSKLCPKCGQKAYDDDDVFSEDKKIHVFKCSCGYYNQTDTEYCLKNNDAIAGFNIAKLSFNSCNTYYILKPKFQDEAVKSIEMAVSNYKDSFDSEFDQEKFDILSAKYKDTKENYAKDSDEYAEFKEYENLRKILGKHNAYLDGCAKMRVLISNGIFFRTSLDTKHNIVIVKGDKCTDKTDYSSDKFKKKYNNCKDITESEFLEKIKPFINNTEN